MLQIIINGEDPLPRGMQNASKERVVLREVAFKAQPNHILCVLRNLTYLGPTAIDTSVVDNYNFHI
jgi:hypothetical protein